MMLVFRYDGTFEGLLTAVFDAYARRSFPERLAVNGGPLPMFADELFEVVTDTAKADRVWAGLRKKLSRRVSNMLTHVWMSEEPGRDELMMRYIRKVFDSPRSVVGDFADPDVLEAHKCARRVSKEVHYVNQFMRFQKAGDDTFFGAMAPKYNVLPLCVDYFKDRFADQKWLIYDIRRNYGYYYDLQTVTEVTLLDGDNFHAGRLDEKLMAEDEKLFQQLWKGYFKSMAIKERINPKLHASNMPRRFWKYLTEKW